MEQPQQPPPPPPQPQQQAQQAPAQQPQQQPPPQPPPPPPTKQKRVKRKKQQKNNKHKMITGYIIYASEIRKEVIRKNPDKDFGDISKLVGMEWKNLPQEAKVTYEKRAYEQNNISKMLNDKAETAQELMKLADTAVEQQQQQQQQQQHQQQQQQQQNHHQQQQPQQQQQQQHPSHHQHLQLNQHQQQQNHNQQPHSQQQQHHHDVAYLQQQTFLSAQENPLGNPAAAPYAQDFYYNYSQAAPAMSLPYMNQSAPILARSIAASDSNNNHLIGAASLQQHQPQQNHQQHPQQTHQLNQQQQLQQPLHFFQQQQQQQQQSPSQAQQLPQFIQHQYQHPQQQSPVATMVQYCNESCCFSSNRPYGLPSVVTPSQSPALSYQYPPQPASAPIQQPMRKNNIIYRKPTVVRLRPKDASTQTDPIRWVERSPTELPEKPLKFSQKFIDYLNCNAQISNPGVLLSDSIDEKIA